MNAKVNRLALGMGVMLAALAGQAQAQPPAPSENATINLIRLLVQQGVLKKEQADALVRQAEAEAQRIAAERLKLEQRRVDAESGTDKSIKVVLADGWEEMAK